MGDAETRIFLQQKINFILLRKVWYLLPGIEKRLTLYSQLTTM